MNTDNLTSKKYSMIDLFKFSSLKIATICNIISFFTIQTIYFAINYSLNGIGINIYLNYVFAEFGDIFGQIIACNNL